MKDKEHAWDLDEEATDAFDQKQEEWNARDWMTWLSEHLTFPFTAVRDEDEEALFVEEAQKQAFRLGHTMEILALDMEDDDGIIFVKAKEGRKKAVIPLCDLEVKPKGKNYWPVREYAVWAANR